jgi:hypothetical protein
MNKKENTFILFGMGGLRRKLLYVGGGSLFDALTLESVRVWDIVQETIDASEYRVILECRDGNQVTIEEDEEGIWIEEAGDRSLLSKGEKVSLPRFEDNPHASLLRALHAEILINVMPFGPVPNLWVYPKPWYRDAAMMLICLEKTGNLSLVEPWVMGLYKVWDRNNNGDPEADNFGQVLFMVSLFEQNNHPIVEKVLKAVPDFHKDDYIIGRTDYAERPVYQTKWLKYGLKSLEMDDPYHIPEMFDTYSALFWMDFREEHVPGERFSEKQLNLYPYLNWAEAHFYNEPPPEPFGDLQPPLTREGAGSEAAYWRLDALADIGAIPHEQAENRMCTPHTWHAAEMFLYLIDNAAEI